MSDNIDTSSGEEADARAQLDALRHRFIDSWGELALIWGTQRSGGRLHSLLYIAPEPLCAEEIGEQLQISHGNTSTTVRHLLASGVIRRVHQAGERKSFFTSEPDPWQWMRNTIRGRRDREVTPVLNAMRGLLEEAEALQRSAPAELAAEAQRVHEKILVFYQFLEKLLFLLDSFIDAPRPAPSTKGP